MATWRVASMALGFLNSIWVARHLGAYKLGISGMVNASHAQALVIIMFGMDALLIRKYKNLPGSAATELVRTAVAYRLFTTCIIAALSIPFVAWYGTGRPDWHLGLSLAYPLLFCLALTPTWLLSALERQPALYRSNFWGVLLSLLCNVLLVNRHSPAGTDLIAQLACSIVVLIITCKAAGLNPTALFSFHGLRKSWELMVESRWLATMACLIYLYLNFEVPLLGYLTTMAEVGRYRTAVNLTSALQSILAVIPMLLYPRFVEWAKAGPLYLWQRQKHLALVFAVFILPAVVLAFVAMPLFFRWCYGDEFVSAALPATILLTAKMMVLLNGIFGAGLLAQCRDKHMMLLTLGIACLSVLLNLITIPRWGMLAAASVNLISESVMLAGSMYLCHRWVYQARERSTP